MVKTVKIKIEGMAGLNCAMQLQRTLCAVPTVKGGSVSIGEATVEHENASDEQLLQAVCAAGNYRGEIMTAPVARIMSKWEVWGQKLRKVLMVRNNLDSSNLPASNLPPVSSLRASPR
jgi:copper chaperone CopZ